MAAVRSDILPEDLQWLLETLPAFPVHSSQVRSNFYSVREVLMLFDTSLGIRGAPETTLIS